MRNIFSVILLLNVYNVLNAQQPIDQIKWIDLGFGKAKVRHQFEGINFSINGNGKLVPFLTQQVGLNSTFPFELFGGSSSSHSFVHTNIGSGWTTRVFMLTGFIGPAFVFHKNEDHGDFKSAIGFNVNMKLLLKFSTHYGVGLEAFKMNSRVGNSIGIKIVLHISNGLE